MSESLKRVLDEHDKYTVNQLLKKAVSNYSKKVSGIQKDAELSQAKELLGEDIKNHSEAVSVLVKNVEFANSRVEAFLTEDKETIRCSLTCLITDIEAAQKRVWEKLEAEPEFKIAANEVRIAKALLDALA
jgi:hypothetical protein